MRVCKSLPRETEFVPTVFANAGSGSEPPALFEERERVYSALFGECDYVYHEQAVQMPHVDVFRFPPTAKRPFFTFVTAGMSDLPMRSPDELGPDYRRVELVFYAADDNPAYAALLVRQAHFPHKNATWIHWGHTVTNGSPSKPVLGSRVLDCLLFLPSPRLPDSGFGRELSWEGEPIHLLWCVPISTAECTLVQEQGVDAMYSLFCERKHPLTYADDRASYA